MNISLSICIYIYIYSTCHIYIYTHICYRERDREIIIFWVIVRVVWKRFICKIERCSSSVETEYGTRHPC